MKKRTLLLLLLCMALLPIGAWAGIDATGLELELLTDMGGNSFSTVIYGNYALTTAGPRLIVLDISSPVNPQQVASLRVADSYISDMALYGHYLLATTLLNGTYIIDLSQITAPELITHIPLDYYNCKNIKVSGDLAAISYGGNGIDLYDISDPTAPQLLNHLSFNVYAFDMHDSRLFVRERRKLSIWDLTDPVGPQMVLEQDMDVYNCHLIRFFDDLLVMAEDTDLVYYFVSELPALQKLATIPLNYSTPQGVEIRDDLMYVSSGRGFSIVNMSDINNPVIQQKYSIRSVPVDVDLVGNLAYITLQQNNIVVYDITDPNNLVYVTKWNDLVPLVRDLVLDETGQYLFSTSEYNGVNTFDVSNPAAPQHVDNFWNGFPADGIAIYGNRAYMGFGGRLDIIDISDKSQPQFKNLLQDGDLYEVIGIYDGRLYWVTEDQGVIIYDLTDPDNPQKIGQTGYFTEYPSTICFDGTLVLVTDTDTGLNIFDITDPANPVDRGRIDILHDANDVAIGHNGYAYVVNLWSSYIDIIDYSNPDNPVKVDSVLTPIVYPKCAHINNNILYIGGNEGLYAFDISDPLQPVPVMDEYRVSGVIQDIITIDDKLYTGDFVMGLSVYQSTETELPEGILVTNTNPDGPGSLYAAITTANEQSGPDTIRFAIPLSDERYDEASGAWTIYVDDPLPSITDSGLVILGDSQKEFIGSDTNPNGPEIGLTGQATYSMGCFNVYANNVEISGLAIYRFGGTAVHVENVSNLRVWGCYIGLMPDGQMAGANNMGIWLWNKSRNCIIGATTEHPYPNVISKQENTAIFISDSSSNNIISGNIIGTNRVQDKKMGNAGAGIALQDGADGNRIYDNIICDNATGIQIFNGNHNEIHHNVIGTLRDESVAWGNVGAGIIIHGADEYQSIHDNIIAYNGEYGVDVGDTIARYNTISKNSIYNNAMGGIIHRWGSNASIIPPVITSFDGVQVTGSTGANYTVEVFSDSGSQGRAYLGSTTANASGVFRYTLTETMPYPYLTVTATTDSGATSAFSDGVMTNITTPQNAPDLPTSYALGRNYPNPFNAGTRIPYQLVETGRVRIELYNINGQKVYTLLNQEQSAGYHELLWNGHTDAGFELPSGVYFIHLQVNGYVAREKMLLLK